MTELLKEFEREFEKLKLKSSLKDLDEAFYVKDVILKDGYISPNLSKQICRRIIDMFSSWVNYLHGLLIPNPNSIIGITEGQVFNEEEKEKITKLLDRLMVFSTQYNLVMLGNRKDKEFIDSALDFWKKECSPQIMKIMGKVGNKWDERLKSKPTKEDKDLRRIYG